MAPPPISFAGCDYLGLRRDPRVLRAASEELSRSGLGAGASRATTGGHPAHDALEAALAEFLGTEAALLLPSGILANFALGGAVIEPGEAIHIDPRSHSSLRAAASLAGARPLERRAGHRVVMTDGVFPSRGEIADLPALLAALPDDGWLIVDDCHGLGVTGPGGRGSVRHHGIDDLRVVHTVTLSKALGCAGGAVAGPREVIERVVRSDLHVGSTALPPAWAAAGLAALTILRDEPERHRALVDAIATARELLPAAGVSLPGAALPVFRIDRRNEGRLAMTSRALAESGFDVPHIRYPDGPAHGYLRLMISAERTRDEIGALASRLAPLLGEGDDR